MADMTPEQLEAVKRFFKAPDIVRDADGSTPEYKYLSCQTQRAVVVHTSSRIRDMVAAEIYIDLQRQGFHDLADRVREEMIEVATGGVTNEELAARLAFRCQFGMGVF